MSTVYEFKRANETKCLPWALPMVSNNLQARVQIPNLKDFRVLNLLKSSKNWFTTPNHKVPLGQY